jgi:hypothetical protein
VIVRRFEGLSQGGSHQADWAQDYPADPVIAFARVPAEGPEGPGYVATTVNITIRIFNENGSEAPDDDDLRLWVIGEHIEEGEGEDPDYSATRIALNELEDK